MNSNLEMQVNKQINKTQAGLYIVTYSREKAPLDVQEAAFAANRLEIVFPAQLGFLRAKEDKGTFKRFSRTNTDVLYDDRNNYVIIVPDGAINKLVGIANLVQAHRQDEDYFIPKNQRDLVYAMVNEMLRKDTAFTANHGQTNVSTSEFEQTELTFKLFSDEALGIKAQDYGDWLQSQGRKTQSIIFDDRTSANIQKGPYVNRLRVCSPDNNFVVYGSGRGLDNGIGAFGVRFEKTAESSAKKL